MNTEADKSDKIVETDPLVSKADLPPDAVRRDNAIKERYIAFAQQSGGESAIAQAESRADAAFLLHSAGLKVVPLKVDVIERYDVPEIDFIDHFPLTDFRRLFAGQNIGVELGKKSQNLAVIRCNSHQSLMEVLERRPNIVAYVSSGNGSYFIWFRCNDGEIRNSTAGPYDVLGKGIVIAPPSAFPGHGEYTWLKMEGELPPALSAGEIEAVFPEVRFRRRYAPPSPGQFPEIWNEDVLRLIDWADARQWPGRTGITDHRVFLACCFRANLEAIDGCRCSAREIGELAGVGESTASKALRRLIRAGFLGHVADKKGSGYVYQILVNPEEQQAEQVTLPGYECSLGAFLNHDAFRIKALKPSAAAILAALYQEPATSIKSLARRTKRGHKTVKDALERLLAHGLIEHTDGMWIPREYDRMILDQIARACGTAGTLEGVKETHRKQRRMRASRSTMREIRTVSANHERIWD